MDFTEIGFTDEEVIAVIVSLEAKHLTIQGSVIAVVVAASTVAAYWLW